MEPILVNPSEERRILDFRPLGFDDVAVLGRYSYATAHDVLEDHSHGDMLEICFLESGEQTYVVAGRPCQLTGGDLFVTFPGEQHGTGHAPEGKGKLYWLLLFVPRTNESLTEKRLLSLTPAETGQLMRQLLRLPRQFRAIPDVKRTLQRIFEIFDSDDSPLRIAGLRNLLLQFLLDVIQSADRREHLVSAEMLAVQQYIIDHLEQPLTVRDLARYACLSQSRLKARFKAEVGVPPADFVLRQRIARAKTLLAESDATVADIAMTLGFSTSQYFATVFRRYTGQAPSRFRETAGNQP